MVVTQDLTGLLRVLGDPTRLRLLALVELEELSVGELARSLGMAQSRVSNHLRVLRENALLDERHVGPSTYLRLSLAEDAVAGRLWSALRDELASLPEHGGDLQRLRTVLAERTKSTDFFDRVAADWDKIGVDFANGQARQRVIANLLPPQMTIADLGCGTGYFGRALLGLCSHLICVDASQGMLDEARARLEPAPPNTQVDMRLGELDQLPIDDASLDACVAGMVFHHLTDFFKPTQEMRRVLKPGGTAVVLELVPHKETWMHDALGDRNLGVDPGDVLAAFDRAGFHDVRLENVDDRYCPTPPKEVSKNGTSEGLSLYLVRGRVPA